LATQRLLGGRAAPDIVIDGLRDRLRALGLADARPAFVAEAARYEGLAEVAGLDPLERFKHWCGSAPLRARLHDAIVLASRFDQPPAFQHIVRNRLLNVHVLARLTGPNADQGMPVIGRGDRDSV